MATIDSIVKYVMNSPYNTNPSVLRSQLNELEGGGGGDLPREVTSAIENDGLGYMGETPAPITYDGDISGQDVYEYSEGVYVKRVGDYIPQEEVAKATIKAHWGSLLISETYSTADVQAIYSQDEWNILFLNVLNNTTWNDNPISKGLYAVDAEYFFGYEGCDFDNIIINGTKISYTLDKETAVPSGYGYNYYLTDAEIEELGTDDTIEIDVVYTGTQGLSVGDIQPYQTDTPIKTATGETIGWSAVLMTTQQVFSIEFGDGETNIPAGTYLVCIPGLNTYVSEFALVAQPHLIAKKFIPSSHAVITLSDPQWDSDVGTYSADKTLEEIFEESGLVPVWINVENAYLVPLQFMDFNGVGAIFILKMVDSMDPSKISFVPIELKGSHDSLTWTWTYYSFT